MKTAVLFGSSGLIGSNLLDNLINNNTYNKIKIFVRKLPSIDNSKVEVINTDFLDLNTLKEKLTGDDCFFCFIKVNININTYKTLNCPRGEIVRHKGLKILVLYSLNK